MKIRAVVFDLEGTLIDDADVQRQVWAELAARLGAPMSEAVFQTINGKKSEDIVPRLIGRDLGPSLVHALAHEKESRYRALLPEGPRPTAGAAELLARLRRDGVAVALTAAAPAETRDALLATLGWKDAFDVVVPSEDHPSKPAVDVFVAAAIALGVPSSSCLAFEDGWNGVTGAHEAGMHVVGLTTNVAAEVLVRAGAARALADLRDLTDLDALVG